MSLATRTEAAEAFWRDEESPESRNPARRGPRRACPPLNFRPKSFQSLPVERRAKHLAQLSDVSDAIATRALIAYHFTSKRPLMAAFLDALGMAHNDGLITEEDVAAPALDRLTAAVAPSVRRLPAEDVDLYLRTLVALDGTTWEKLDSLVVTGTLIRPSESQWYMPCFATDREPSWGV